MSISKYFDDPALRRQINQYPFSDLELREGVYTLENIAEFILDDLKNMHSLSHVARFERGRLLAPCGAQWTVAAIAIALGGEL